MERIITKQENSQYGINSYFYEEALQNVEKKAENEKEEVLSCNQLLKNLLKTNLRLLKLNDIGTMLLF